MNRKEITCNFSNEGTRNEVRMRVVSKFAEEPPGTGDRTDGRDAEAPGQGDLEDQFLLRKTPRL